MEPNTVPGFANRKIAGRVYRALLGFEKTSRLFPAGRSEVTGLPVRPEFFSLTHKPSDQLHDSHYRRQPRLAHSEPRLERKLALLPLQPAACSHCSPNRSKRT